MLKTFLIALTMLATPVPAMSFTLAQNECLTVEQDAASAAEAGITDTLALDDVLSKLFIAEFAKLQGVAVSDLPDADTVLLRSDPEKTRFFTVWFQRGCFVGGTAIPGEVILEIERQINMMKAQNG